MSSIESKRVSLDRKIDLRFPDFEGFVTEYAANLSMTGMFVRSRLPQPPGTPVSFELRLEDGAPLVRGEGWVVWSRGAGETEEGPAGMGIEFVELDRKSRRLVRWLIRSQLPDGAAPYDVHAGSVETRAPARPAGSRGAHRRRAAVAAAGVLALATLAVLWLRAPGGADDGETEVGAQELPVAAAPRAGLSDALVPSEAPSRLSGAAADAHAAATTGSGADRSAVAAVESVVESWARAWSDQDPDRYLSHYSQAFVPEGGMSRERWVAQRRQRVQAPRSIRVSLTRIETRFLSESEARVSFLQTYRSDSYVDTVDKVLELETVAGAWKIRREHAD